MSNEVAEKKQRILDTALEMILENGVQSASMGKISKAAGVAVGTIYHYFSSKEELITELYRTHKLNFLKTLESTERGGSLEESFRAHMKSYIKYGIEYPKEFQFINAFYQSPIIDKAVAEEIERTMFGANSSISEFFHQNDLLKSVPPSLSLLYVNGALTQTIRAYLEGEIGMSEEDWDSLIDMLWDGITV